MFFKISDPEKKQVSIIDEINNNIYQLSNGEMIKKDAFKKYYSRMETINENKTNFNSSNDITIDPDAFFSIKPLDENYIQNKIQNINPSAIKETGAPSSVVIKEKAIYRANESDVKTNTVNPYNQPMSSFNKPKPNVVVINGVEIPDNTHTDTSMYKVYEDEDEAFEDLMKKQNGTQQSTQQPNDAEKERLMRMGEEYTAMLLGNTPTQQPLNDRPLRPRYQQEHQQEHQQEYQQPQLSPSEMMFSTFKRNYDIKINITITDKIGKPEFVKGIVENMEGDIVGYYKKIIMENFMNNIKSVEDKVGEELNNIIFGEKKEKKKPVKKNTEPVEVVKLDKKPIEKPKRPKPQIIKEGENPINETIISDVE